MQAGFETLVEAGYDPRNAYFECIHEMKLIVDLIYAGGFKEMRYSISNTAEFGDYETGKRLVTDETKKEMKKILEEIQDGTFASKWIAENKNGRCFFNSKRQQLKKHQMEIVGEELRKNMIIEAAPPGVHVHVIPISKLVQVDKDPRFGATKAMVLFETPQDLLRAVEGGVDIKEVNLGSMAHSVGKVVVTNAIAMDNDDVETLEKLAAKGITFDIRKVPADSAESFDAMIKKAKSELAAQ